MTGRAGVGWRWSWCGVALGGRGITGGGGGVGGIAVWSRVAVGMGYCWG